MPKDKIHMGLQASIALALVLTGCTDNEDQNQSAYDESSQNDNQIANEEFSQHTLMVDEYKCSGCGKCIRFDPDHFVFNGVSRKAEVISNKNLDTENLTLAIAVCRDRAISII